MASIVKIFQNVFGTAAFTALCFFLNLCSVEGEALGLRAGSETGAPAQTVHQISGTAMGMPWSVKWVGTLDKAQVEKEAATWLRDIEMAMSNYRADSEIAHFNAATSTNWFPISTNLANVAELSLNIARQTEGALDPTVFPLVKAWGFGPERRLGQMPTVKEIAAAKALVGYTNLQVRMNPPALRKLRPNVTLDFNAVAMGYTADGLHARLQQLGGTNYLIDMCGELVARGGGPEGKGWPVGIEQPDSNGQRIQRLVNLRDQALATSGDDHNFREINGKRYHHIIDPRTGWPAELHVASATVISASCGQADGWATAMVVLGVTNGLPIVSREKLNVLWITRDKDGYHEHFSPIAEVLFRPVEVKK
jgi:thiamine biosynthesis lipoprotein